MKNLLLALASVFFIAACGGSTAAAAPPTPVKFTMTTQNGSGVTGTGEIVKGTGSFTLTIKLTGMTPNSAMFLTCTQADAACLVASCTRCSR